MILENNHINLVLKDTGWVLKGKSITKTFKFDSFGVAIQFVNQVADISDERNHYPQIEINKDRVKLFLSTHDEGGVTDMDITLAADIDELE